MDNNKSLVISLTDLIHLQLFGLYIVIDSLDIRDENKNIFIQIIDFYGEFLINPSLSDDNKLLSKIRDQNAIFQSSELFKKLEENEKLDPSKKDEKLNKIYVLIKNLQNIAENPDQYCKLRNGNRFENQKNNIPEKNFKNHKIKPLDRFFSLSKKNLGRNKGNFNFKRIIEPGNIELDGKTITVGKNHKKFSESKYLNAGLTKYANRSAKDDNQLKEKFSKLKEIWKDNIYAIYSYKTVKNNEFYADVNENLVSNIIEVMSPDKHYKIRYIDSDGAMQIKLLKHAISLYALIEKNEFNIQKTYDLIDENSFLDTLVINFLIGIGDRINTENTMIDKNGNLIPIDYTRLIGNIHNDRYLRFEKAILKNDIELMKKILIEDLYADISARDHIFKTSNFDDNEIKKYKKKFMIQLSEKLLSEVSDEEFLKTIQKFTIKEKIEKIKNIYDDWVDTDGLDQVDLDENLINQDIPYGLNMIRKAIEKNLKEKSEQSNNLKRKNTNESDDRSNNEEYNKDITKKPRVNEIIQLHISKPVKRYKNILSGSAPL